MFVPLLIVQKVEKKGKENKRAFILLHRTDM